MKVAHPNAVSNIPYTHAQLFEATKTCLVVATEVLKTIRSDPEYSSLSEKIQGGGRASAKLFEDLFVVPALKRADISAEIYRRILSYDIGLFSFIGFVDPKNNNIVGDEKGEIKDRYWADIFVLFMLEETGDLLYIPVNIKWTSGEGADNLCGWEPIAHVICEEETDDTRINRKTKLFNRIKKDGVDSTIRDYFFWSFTRGDERTTFNKAKVFSLLSISPEKYTFNSNQPMPVQFRFSSEVSFDLLKSNLEMKRRFLKWLLGKQVEEGRKRLKLQEETLNAL